MARYQVPQFLEIEDKIFGPFTLKQFLYIGAGLALGYIAWSTLPIVVAVILGMPVVGLFFALALYEPNNRPFAFFLETGFKYLTASKLYLWKKQEKDPEKRAAEVLHNATQSVPKITNSKLKDLSWGLDIHETLNTLEDLSNIDKRS